MKKNEHFYIKSVSEKTDFVFCCDLKKNKSKDLILLSHIHISYLYGYIIIDIQDIPINNIN